MWEAATTVPQTGYPEPTGIDKILVETYGYEWVNGKAWPAGTAPEPENPAQPETNTRPQPELVPSLEPEATPEIVPEQAESEADATPAPEPIPAPMPSYPAPTGVDKILVETYGYEWVNGKAWPAGTAPEPETPVEPEPISTPTPQPETTPYPEPEDNVEPAPVQSEAETASIPTPELAPAPIPNYPEPSGVDKILVETFGYEWVNGKAWPAGTAPEPETPIQPETGTTPTPQPEPAPAPAPSYPEPTGVNKILVETYGYEWVNGKAWPAGNPCRISDSSYANAPTTT